MDWPVKQRLGVTQLRPIVDRYTVVVVDLDAGQSAAGGLLVGMESQDVTDWVNIPIDYFYFAANHHFLLHVSMHLIVLINNRIG